MKLKSNKNSNLGQNINLKEYLNIENEELKIKLNDTESSINDDTESN